MPACPDYAVDGLENMRTRAIVAVYWILLALAGCSRQDVELQEQVSVQSTEIAELKLTVAAPTATPTPMPTNTPVPTNTPLALTPTPGSTATPVATRVSIATAPPTAAAVAMGETALSGGRGLTVYALCFWSSSASSGEDALLLVGIENATSRRVAYGSSQFRLENGLGNITGPVALTDLPSPIASGELAPGGIVNGTLGFRISKGDRDLVLIYRACDNGCEEARVSLVEKCPTQ